MAIRSDSKIDEKLTEQLRLEFVEGYIEGEARIYPTLEQLIKRHDLPKNTLYRRAQEGDWMRQRSEFKAIYDQQRNQDRARLKAEKADKFDDTSLTLSENILARIGRKLTLAARRDSETGTDSISTKELKDIAETVLKAQRAGKLALGEASEIKQVVADESVPDSLTRIIDQLDELASAKSQRANHTLQ